MKTIAYVDGYNLYYSLLRGTEFKWLDLVELLDHILKIQDPSAELSSVRYFSAPVLGSYANHGNDSVTAQNNYHRALMLRHPERLRIILGKHLPDRAWLPKAIDGQPLNRSIKERVWQMQEKQTDVNLTLDMYRDALNHKADQLVLLSNDTDFEPLLTAIRADTEIRLGLITPLPKRAGLEHRRPSVSLMAQAQWTRTHILDEELAAHQLPPHIPTQRKPVRKPTHW